MKGEDGSFFMTLRARKCCCNTSWRRLISLALLSLRLGTSMISLTCAWWIKRGLLYRFSRHSIASSYCSPVRDRPSTMFLAEPCLRAWQRYAIFWGLVTSTPSCMATENMFPECQPLEDIATKSGYIQLRQFYHFGFCGCDWDRLGSWCLKALLFSCECWDQCQTAVCQCQQQWTSWVCQIQ